MVVSLGRMRLTGVMNSGLGMLSLNSLVIVAGLCWASGHRHGGQGGDEHRGRTRWGMISPESQGPRIQPSLSMGECSDSLSSFIRLPLRL